MKLGSWYNARKNIGTTWNPGTHLENDSEKDSFPFQVATCMKVKPGRKLEMETERDMQM